MKIDKDYIKTLCRALNRLTNEHSETYRRMCILELDGEENCEEYAQLKDKAIEISTKIHVIRKELGVRR